MDYLSVKLQSANPCCLFIKAAISNRGLTSLEIAYPVFQLLFFAIFPYLGANADQRADNSKLLFGLAGSG